MAISLIDIKKTYREPDGRERVIVDIPKFGVVDGQKLCIVGRSGSGKTTLLNLIAGIVRPDHGQVFVGSRDLGTLSESKCDRFRAQNIGYVFQTFNLLQSLTALENVMLAMTFAGLVGKSARQNAQEILKRVGLSTRQDAKPGQLSVGEQQRVAIARAIANRPQVVLADEPTANLDDQNSVETIELLKEVTAEAESILILVTHDQVVRQSFSDVIEFEAINR